MNASSLVTKVYFPREVLPTAAVFTKLVELVFGFVILAMLMLYYGKPPADTVDLGSAVLPHPLDLHAGAHFSACRPQSLLPRRPLPRGSRADLWFYLTPIIYPIDIVPEKYLWIFELNPNSLFINAYRRVILYGEAPDSKRCSSGRPSPRYVHRRLLPIQEDGARVLRTAS